MMMFSHTDAQDVTLFVIGHQSSGAVTISTQPLAAENSGATVVLYRKHTEALRDALDALLRGESTVTRSASDE